MPFYSLYILYYCKYWSWSRVWLYTAVNPTFIQGNMMIVTVSSFLFCIEHSLFFFEATNLIFQSLRVINKLKLYCNARKHITWNNNLHYCHDWLSIHGNTILRKFVAFPSFFFLCHIFSNLWQRWLVISNYCMLQCSEVLIVNQC